MMQSKWILLLVAGLTFLLCGCDDEATPNISEEPPYTDFPSPEEEDEETVPRVDLPPPEEDLVQVRVVRTGLGRIATEHGGSVELDLGTTHYLPRGDVEHLIRQGALQQLDGEEHA